MFRLTEVYVGGSIFVILSAAKNLFLGSFLWELYTVVPKGYIIRRENEKEVVIIMKNLTHWKDFVKPERPLPEVW